MTAGLILLRHGESLANAGDLFTGSLDVDLTDHGRGQSALAGRLIRTHCPAVGVILSSPLTRACDTARIIQHTLATSAELLVDWRLIERSYGALTGRCRAAVLHQFGPTQFVDWRRSVHHAPPPLSDDQVAILRSQPALQGLPPQAVAATESLHDVIVRVRPVIAEAIIPRTAAGRTVLVVAHGNSLRALVGALDGLDDQQLQRLNIPAGQPFAYQLRNGRPIAGSRTYLDPIAAHHATVLLDQQGGT